MQTDTVPAHSQDSSEMVCGALPTTAGKLGKGKGCWGGRSRPRVG